MCTSQAYPHIYPGFEPHDRLVILEDVDGDGKRILQRFSLMIFMFPCLLNSGMVRYVSEQPNLTFLQDVDGDDRADVHEVVLSGFAQKTRIMHYMILSGHLTGHSCSGNQYFTHSQIETPYGPVRQQNSGWFRYEPKSTD